MSIHGSEHLLGFSKASFVEEDGDKVPLVVYVSRVILVQPAGIYGSGLQVLLILQLDQRHEKHGLHFQVYGMVDGMVELLQSQLFVSLLHERQQGFVNRVGFGVGFNVIVIQTGLK